MWLAQSHTHAHTIKTSGAYQIRRCFQGYRGTCGHANSIVGELCNVTVRLWISVFEETSSHYSLKEFLFDVT